MNLFLVIVALLSTVAMGEPARHPLDPLSSVEISSAVQVIESSGLLPKDCFYAQVSLSEPPKAEVLKHRGGAAFRREAFVILLDKATSRTYEAVVDLRGLKLLSSREVPGAQPAVLSEEFKLVPEIVKADVRWQQAMKRRGIYDFENVLVDPWASGAFRPQYGKNRLLRGLSYYKKGAFNVYARPIEGVSAVVDMSARKVIEFKDDAVVPLSHDTGAFDAETLKPTRALKPLKITQPDGASFTLNGHEVSWDKWRFRFALHPREGLVLYQAGISDNGATRPVLYRASLSEMAVPYGDPESGWSWRSAFDVGEYGVGRLASPLESGRDVPENALLLDVDFADDFGKAYVLPRALALYERDSGVLWKHFDSYTSKNESRRGRELVISFFAAVANYDYGMSWVFHQDGTLEYQAELTGIMLAKGVAKPSGEHGSHGQSGHLVSENIVAPHHQHFFSFRLDLDVDGPRNSVYEMNSRSLPSGKENPEGNAFVMEETLLDKENWGRRSLDLSMSRRWKVANAKVQNSLDMPTAYVLVAGENSVPYALPHSTIRERARFLDHHLWVTRYKPEELYASGDYPNQGQGGEGLPRWVSDDESIKDEDVVLWYALGVTHVPRPEEWPVMPTHRTGFKLAPAGFFARNPVLDVR